MDRNVIATTKYFVILIVLIGGQRTEAQQTEPASSVVSLWGDDVPPWVVPDEPEHDSTTSESNQVAGRRVIRLGNVSDPQLHVYPAADSSKSDTTVVICPGGGYSILAWDLEGTEVASWLQSIGVNAVVLKYRVPTRDSDQRWLAPVQDIQRAISLVRSGKVDGIKSTEIGVLGFSAGGNAAARALTSSKRHYRAIDDADQASFRPSFGVLVYPAWLVKRDAPSELIDEITVDEETPPVFFAHAFDDRVSCLSSIGMFAELKKHDVPSSLHVFSGGGHGFGLRRCGAVTDQWPNLCARWLRQIGVVKQ